MSLEDDYIEIQGSLIKKTEILAVSKVVRSGAAYVFKVRYFDIDKIIATAPTLEACEVQRDKFIRTLFCKNDSLPKRQQ